jgi:abortive infection bacteriophage resistance protein
MNGPAKKPYNKPPLSIDNQVLLLKERGLIVGDESQLKYYLRNISYYHLSVYFKFYQSGDTFIEGITFEDVLRVYTFDNKLRFLLLELLERIEKSFKCRIAYELSVSNNDSHCYLNESFF